MGGAYLYGWDSVNKVWVKLKGTATGKLIVDPSLILENPPTEDESKKAPSSEWAYDHKADASAHHAKYTNAEALAACGLDGTLYWSCAGCNFDATLPDVDDITKETQGILVINVTGIFLICSVYLPNGATITKVIVYGNASAESQNWYFRRLTLSGGAWAGMGSAKINTEDTSISLATVNNSLYTYVLTTDGFTAGAKIYGARITYTL